MATMFAFFLNFILTLKSLNILDNQNLSKSSQQVDGNISHTRISLEAHASAFEFVNSQDSVEVGRERKALQPVLDVLQILNVVKRRALRPVVKGIRRRTLLPFGSQ